MTFFLKMVIAIWTSLDGNYCDFKKYKVVVAAIMIKPCFISLFLHRLGSPAKLSNAQFCETDNKLFNWFFAQIDNDYLNVSSSYFVSKKCTFVVLVLVHLRGMFVEMEFLLVSFAAKFTTMRTLVFMDFGNVAVKSVI